MTRLFLYGTLKRGCRNHHYLAGQQFVAVAHTAPGYRLMSLGSYPGMVPRTDGRSIEGELWDVDADCLHRLDILEGVAEGEYALVPVPLLPPFADASVQTYVYLQSVTGATDVSPVWREE